MSEANNHVVFKGQLAADVAEDIAKQKLAALFKINVAQAEAMLSGKPVFIKKNVDLPTAQKYQAAMQKAGAIAEIVSSTAAPVKEVKEAAAQNTSNTAKTAASTAASSSVALPGNNATTDIPETQAPQTSVALNAQVDTSAISMAETGSILQNTAQEVAEPELNLDGLSLAAAGEGELSQENDIPAVKIDTSGLSLE